MKRKLIVCFAGIDGSGKTTVAKALHESLCEAGISSHYMWCGWRGFESWLFKPVIAPTKNALIRRGNDSQVTSAHERIPFFDYFMCFDYFVRVYPALLISLLTNDVLVVDRYVYDIMQGLSTHGSTSQRIVFRLLKVFPRPSVIFFIEVPIEVAYARKGDIPSLQFLRESDIEKRRLLESLNNKVVTLDGTRPVSELANETLATIRELRA